MTVAVLDEIFLVVTVPLPLVVDVPWRRTLESVPRDGCVVVLPRLVTIHIASVILNNLAHWYYPLLPLLLECQSVWVVITVDHCDFDDAGHSTLVATVR